MTNFAWFKPIFVLELIIAESRFLNLLPVRKHFAIKLPISLAALFGVSFLLPSNVTNGVYYSFLFLFLFGLSFLAAMVCFDSSPKNIIFCTITGLTTQHIASELYEIFNAARESYFQLSRNLYDGNAGTKAGPENYFFAVIYVAIFALLYGLVFFFLVPKAKKYMLFEGRNASIVFLSSFIVIFDVIIGRMIRSFLPFKSLSSLDASIKFFIYFLFHFYNIVCCVLSIILLIEIPRRSFAEGELRTTERLYALEKEQYKTIKDNLDFINIKCHDLKHQRRTILAGKEIDHEERKDRENAIDIYDSAYKTKNEALNVVLREKGRICKKEGIELTCIIDASTLSFLKDYDVYSLFGNIFDNAIEALRQVKEKKKVLALQINTKGNFLRITSYNRFVGDLRFENGIPVTTKKDKINHGYGLKSISNIVKKYGGQLRIKTKDNIYTLTILFQIDK